MEATCPYLKYNYETDREECGITGAPYNYAVGPCDFDYDGCAEYLTKISEPQITIEELLKNTPNTQ